MLGPPYGPGPHLAGGRPLTLDPKDDSVAETPKANPFDGVAASFLDVLVLFLRTIPLYPDGHGRVVAVTEKFQAALAERGTATVVEPTEGGLRVDGEDHPSLSNGAQAFRDALVRTAVSRVTFQADAPHASYVVFARSLQRNARLAQSGHLTFADLWMAPLEGIAVEEQTFSREDFTGEPTDGSTVIGGRRDEGGDGGSGSGGGTGDGLGAGDGRGTGRGGAGRGSARGIPGATGTVEAPAVEAGATPAVKAPPRRGRTLRALVLDDADAAAVLARVREKLAARGEFDDGTDGPRHDVLDHLLASLPIEARLDLGRGVTLVRDVLKRLEASLDGAGGRKTPEMSSALLRAMENVFSRTAWASCARCRSPRCRRRPPSPRWWTPTRRRPPRRPPWTTSRGPRRAGSRTCRRRPSTPRTASPTRPACSPTRSSRRRWARGSTSCAGGSPRPCTTVRRSRARRASWTTCGRRWRSRPRSATACASARARSMVAASSSAAVAGSSIGNNVSSLASTGGTEANAK